ncbi:hypothetical protein PPERSA_04434 [Pseudocohnilembus persalinus]|uniref:Phospholipid scramblase n=1 Tax=Pseudocohnilembus persalinus TaxID=266149 RepID=A0A0V0QQS9_PSEPJ|nr:hypothetical protein PPERSA_04434 [Pseudocohnilembus persalinus]|eukprot:KRX04619.1 hypothetical protein PPERSA_04434 [Pseudocohnilembus persalinus]
MAPQNQYGQQNYYEQQMMMPGQPVNNMYNQQQVYPYNNQMMAGQPMMPNQNQNPQFMAMQQQQANFLLMMGGGFMQNVPFNQDTSNHLLQSDGYTKLASSNTFYLKGTQTSGCSDIFCCQEFYNKHAIKFNQFSAYTALQLDLEEPSCGASNIKGQVKNFRYGQQGEVLERQPIFDIEHNRTCCALKCMFSWQHVFGMCGFYLCSLCFPSKSKLKKDQITQNIMKYGCCGSSVTISDNTNQKKYTIKSAGHLSMALYDSNDQQIEGFSAQIRDFTGNGKSRRVVGLVINFPQNISVEDKISILLSFSRIH